ncbi:Zinc finger protein-like 1 -like protein [Toxocara canis]|uniref:Zinc finger protein-like 1 homolog n=1 Tax=Toxocara canis TaxID=6265 RepID=A0A0B2V1H0_TOXCA|nr:Zinc finger protein-like 1 -like protein [Toxocara canis]
MGLCKCPKKKVTNLFCFEHRVNVCEHCLVESHPKCVVQSYLSWLTDSDYDTNCSLCSNPLADKETVRLQCLHLFHWECLDAWARRFPANTAPAGYRCHLCREAIFPAPNQTSPTIEILRTTLQRANWARAGLGLSLLPEVDGESVVMRAGEQEVSRAAISAVEGAPRSATPATILNVDGVYAPSEQHLHFTARKPLGSSDDESNLGDARPLLSTRLGGRDEDLPENKYKRRSAGEWLSRWLRSRYGGGSRADAGFGRKRLCFIVLIAIVVLLTSFTLLTRILSGPSDDDPAFDPLANPNIRVAAVHESRLN